MLPAGDAVSHVAVGLAESAAGDAGPAVGAGDAQAWQSGQASMRTWRCASGPDNFQAGDSCPGACEWQRAHNPDM